MQPLSYTRRCIIFQFADGTGWGNRMRAQATVFLLAMITDRLFLIDHPQFSLCYQPPEGLNWEFQAFRAYNGSKRGINPHGNAADRELVQTVNLSEALPETFWIHKRVCRLAMRESCPNPSPPPQTNNRGELRAALDTLRGHVRGTQSLICPDSRPHMTWTESWGGHKSGAGTSGNQHRDPCNTSVFGPKCQITGPSGSEGPMDAHTITHWYLW